MSQPLLVPDTRLRGSGLLFAAATIAVVASVAATAARGVAQPDIALAFAGFITLGEFLRLRLPGDREAAPLGAAGSLAYALLPDVASTPSTHDALQVVAVTACGMLAGGLPHLTVGRAPGIDYLARRILVVGFVAATFRPLYVSGGSNLYMHHTVLLAGYMVLVVVASVVLDATLAGLVRAGRGRTPFPAALRDELRSQFGIVSAIGATGMLIALTTGVTGLWAIPVFSVPLLLTQFAFRRYASIRATYLQTVRALSRVTEVGGYTETGHSRRVCQLALAVGRELGMSEPDLLDLEYAALMHDIGQLALTDPIPGGATVVASAADQQRIAQLGAKVIRQTGVLDEVATIVELQAEPYRRPHEPGDVSVPLASRIIKTVNAYDDLVAGSLETVRRLEALERLRLGMAYEYDPRVVESLARVVERSSWMGL
jgi:hypothetical protein